MIDVREKILVAWAIARAIVRSDFYRVLRRSSAVASSFSRRFRIAAAFSCSRRGRFYCSQRPVDFSKKNVLFIGHEASRTGAPMVHLNIVERLSDKFNVVSLTIEGGPLLEEIALHSVVTACMGRRSTPFSLCLEIVQGRLRPDFIILNSAGTTRFIPELRKLNVPITALIHEYASYLNQKTREMLLASDHIVFSTRSTLNNAIAKLPDSGLATKARVLPQGRCRASHLGEDRLFQERLFPEGSSRKSKIVVGMGQVQIRKGCDLFILCAAQFFTLWPDSDVKFVWIGSGNKLDDLNYGIYLAEQIERSNLEGKVAFVEDLPSVEGIHQYVDALLLTSRLDPLPNVAIDAICEGVPVISFDKASGIPEICGSVGLSSTLVAPYLDTAKMAELLHQVLNDEALARRLKNDLRKLGEATFNMDDYAKAIVQMSLS
jgi:glycosyltransferase involved in cell wall biosynthesis